MVLAQLERPTGKPLRRIGFRLALVINLLVTLGVGIGTAPLVGGAFGSNSLKGIDFGSTPIWRPFTPFDEENVTRTDQPVPDGCSGVWVTLIGRGGDGSTSNGGYGGGGGAYVARTFIPRSSLGATYTVARTPFVSQTNRGAALFTSGSLNIEAANGLPGSGIASPSRYGEGGAVSATGVTPAAGSGPGGQGGSTGSAGSNAVGGGGGGGGASTSSFGAISGGKGGNSTTSGGGTGSSGASGNGNASNGGNGTLSPGRPGGGGGGAGTLNNFGFQQSGNAGDGGDWGAGGGGRGSGTGGTTGSEGDGGLAYTLLEWE